MIIDPAVRHCLPEKYQDKLGPFRSLAQGAKYMRMDISERCVPRKEKLHKLTCRSWSPLPKKNLKLEVNELIAQGLLLRAQLNMEMSAAQNAQLRHTRDVETGIRTLLQLPQLDTDTNVEVTAALLSKDMQRMRALLVHRGTDEAERRAAAREQQSTASALSLPTSDIENARATASGPLPKKAQLEPSSASALVQDVAGAIHTPESDVVQQADERDGFPSLRKPAVRSTCYRSTDTETFTRDEARVVRQPAEAIVQKVQCVSHEIDELKRQARENKRLYGDL